MPYVMSRYRSTPGYMARAGYGAAALYQHRRTLGTAWKLGKAAYKYAMSSKPKASTNDSPAVSLKARPTKRRKPRKRLTKRAKDIQQCKSAIKELRQSESASLGTMTYRNLKSGRCVALANQQGAVEQNDMSTTSSYEAVLSKCKYFDPSTPGTLITSDVSLGTYQRNFMFKSLTSKMQVRNNYQTDADVRVYLCSVKDDTNQSPLTAWTSAIPDGSNLSTTADLNQYPSDYNLVSDLWKMKLVVNTTLSPGQSAIASHTVKDVEIDAAVIDSHGLSYQREYKAFCWLIVTKGTISHDSAVASEQGFAPCGVDFVVANTYVVSYNAGININYIEGSNSLSSFTNGAVQSHQPIPDNIAYSVA